MTKVMLVEDDNNLREIYGARLMAEGYEIISAADGEEALALAVREKPDLIISDVMMPKISGFDMLDILRTTPETKDTKVIMMTALSQPEDRARGESLGADRYLVKSQVTLEDVVATVHDVLGDSNDAGSGQPEQSQVAQPQPSTETAPPTQEPQQAQAPISNQPEVPQPSAEVNQGNATPGQTVQPVQQPAPEPAPEPTPTTQTSQSDTQVSADDNQSATPVPAAEQKQEIQNDIQDMLNNNAIDNAANQPQVSQPEQAVNNTSEPSQQQVANTENQQQTSAEPSQKVEPNLPPPSDPNAPDPNDIAL